MQDNLYAVTFSGCPHFGHDTFKIYCLLAHMLSTRLGYLRPDLFALAFALAFCEEDSFLDLPSDLGLFLFHTFFCTDIITSFSFYLFSFSCILLDTQRLLA
jgi:hypothetical protein